MYRRYEWHATDSGGELIMAGFTLGQSLSFLDVKEDAIRQIVAGDRPEETVRAAFTGGEYHLHEYDRAADEGFSC